MRELAIILLVVFVLLALTAIRYRKQLATMLNLWRMLRSMRQAQKPGGERLREGPRAGGPLVRCPKCGDWVPENRAIKLGSSFFCSAECVERTASAA